MTSAPVIEWRAVPSPNGVLSSLAFTGTGSGGAIPLGSNSTVQQIRLYNNFLAAAGIADATSCVLAVYDDTIHDGLAQTSPTTGLYVQVEVTDYNGSTTGGDIVFYSIGGVTKHPIPVNSGTIGGAVTNYVTINLQIAAPGGGTQGAVSQGLWVEYNSVA